MAPVSASVGRVVALWLSASCRLPVGAVPVVQGVSMPVGGVAETSMFDKDRKKKVNASAVSGKNKWGSRFIFFFFRYFS